MPVDDDPQELIRRARNGDEQALGQLLGKYNSYLSLVARLEISRRLQSKVDPADLVQETYLKAHRGFPHFRGHTEEELVSWLRQILATSLANLVRHYFGTQARDVRLEQQLAHEIEQSSQEWASALAARQSSPSQHAQRREEVVLLADALGTLPRDYSEVLILRHLQGLSFADVAKKMERSVDSVEKLWIRALRQLRRTLGTSS